MSVLSISCWSCNLEQNIPMIDTTFLCARSLDNIGIKKREDFSQEQKIFRKGSYELEESKQPFQFSSDTLHHKKRRTTNSKSDQEQIPVQKSVDSLTSCKGLDFFRHINKIPRNYQADDLASPATQIPIVHQFPDSNHIDSLKPTFSVQESSHSFRQTQMTRTYPLIRAAPSLAKESNPRSDLQGVVLTLGGPASGHV
ncbi:hypothetical protein OIU84_006860 [Salix udensis]|uniref:Uncharacterized protein n=1 Tax=Salix udensis TaxID=889485 RepID=A0AAD6JZN1_9ROSI|nr:hypothetical protein OIU84_006860 [Salix udensis]